MLEWVEHPLQLGKSLDSGADMSASNKAIQVEFSKYQNLYSPANKAIHLILIQHH